MRGCDPWEKVSQELKKQCWAESEPKVKRTRIHLTCHLQENSAMQILCEEDLLTSEMSKAKYNQLTTYQSCNSELLVRLSSHEISLFSLHFSGFPTPHILIFPSLCLDKRPCLPVGQLYLVSSSQPPQKDEEGGQKSLLCTASHSPFRSR